MWEKRLVPLKTRFYGKGFSPLINFSPSDIHFEKGEIIVSPDKIDLVIDEDDYWELPEDVREAKMEEDRHKGIVSLTLHKCSNSDIIRYTV